MPPSQTRIEDRIKRSPSLRASSLPAQLDRLRSENRRLKKTVQEKEKKLFAYRQRLAQMREEQDRMDP